MKSNRRSSAYFAAAAAVGVLAGTTATSDSPDETSSKPPASAAGVVVRFVQTGGIAGIDVRLVVREDRRATVTARGAATRRHQLRAATLTGLRRTLDAAELDRPSEPTRSGCADCFEYTITYRGQRVSFDQVSVPPRMRVALRELRRIAAGGR